MEIDTFFEDAILQGKRTLFKFARGRLKYQLLGNPCGSGYPNSLFGRKKKVKRAQTNAPIPFAKIPPLIKVQGFHI
jgi:hypothetical protein